MLSIKFVAAESELGIISGYAHRSKESLSGGHMGPPLQKINYLYDRSLVSLAGRRFGLIPNCVQSGNLACSLRFSMRLHRRDACATKFYLFDGNLV